MHQQRGMIIIEIIIGLGLIGVALAMGMYVNRTAEDQSTGRAAADTLSTFQQLASEYYLANRDGFTLAMDGDTAAMDLYCLINVSVANGSASGTRAATSGKHTCAFDTTHLRAARQWPGELTVNADKGRGRYVAIVRQIMDENNVATGADEMLIVTAPLSNGNVMTAGAVAFTGDKARKAEEIAATMATLGGSGGYIPPGADMGPCAYNASSKQACGNGWTVQLSDFID
jgi:type II secretory pathway pseudopilin PulG